MPSRPTIQIPSPPPLDAPADDAVIVSPPGTQEIPQAEPQAPMAMVPPSTLPQQGDLNGYVRGDQLYNGGRGPGDFMVEGDQTSPIGMTLREAHRELKSGEEADGLLIVSIQKNSAAAKAGLLPYKHTVHGILMGASIGAAMLVFPPVMFALPLIEHEQIGESYDMIIGIDGIRVSSFFDFDQRMRGVQAGELVYFNVVRDGKRLQIPVPLPASPTSASN
jgi:hypothetical protein